MSGTLGRVEIILALDAGGPDDSRGTEVTLALETFASRQMRDGRLASREIIAAIERAIDNARETLLLYGADGLAAARGVEVEGPEPA